MSDPLRILLLEDSPTDAELNEHLLRKAGIDFTSLRVETSAAFVAALDTFHPDIILADYKLPEFDGMAALQIVRRDHPEVPVIMVTGALSDIEAVELIHAGAKDYMLKDRPARLAAAVQRALSIEQGIRARKAAEHALRESEGKFRAIFENAKDGIVLTDAESGLVADCNHEFERQCGRPSAQIKTLHVWELRPPEQQEAAHRKFEEIKSTGCGSADLGFQRPDGTFMPAEVIATRVRLGNRDYVISISRDITDRKRAEQALQESESKYRRLIDNSPDIAYTFSVKRGGIYYSSQVITILGYSVEHLYDYPFLWNESIHPEDRAVVAKAIEGFKVGTPFKIEYRIKNARGDRLWFYDRSIGGREENGDFIIEGLAMDITERKQAEAQLAEQLEELRRWHVATSGREGRILELKHEINELLVQAGQPPRYPSAET